MTAFAPRIDAHQHFWHLSRGDYAWLTPALAPIYRDYGPADLAPLRKAQGIAASILVQAAPTEAETLFLLDIAKHDESVAGVVGWCDFEAADAAARIARLAADPLLVGLRPMVQDIPDPDWLLHPNLGKAFTAMQHHGLIFDALIRPLHLPRLLQLAGRYPGLHMVIDHGAKPDLRRGVDHARWCSDIAALAALPQMHCKLSGLITEAGDNWQPVDILPAMQHLLNCFGATRLLWGSDWPVLELAGDYADWFALCQSLAASLPLEARADIFGGNAARLYLSQRGRRVC